MQFQSTPQFDVHPSMPELAWAAGLFEGEGSIYSNATSKQGRWAMIVISLGSTDEDIVQRFRAIFGVGTILPRVERRRSLGIKTMFYWTAYSAKAVVVLRQLLPWFGERRRAKAEQALRIGATLQLRSAAKTHCPQGHPYDAANTRVDQRGWRKCRICDAARQREKKRRQRAEVLI